MPAPVLIAHASSHGSTVEVAESIAAALRHEGLDADVRPAADVRAVEPYDAVVLGGAIYTGRWHRDARSFVHRHRRALVGKPFAVFGMGPRTLGDEDVAASRGVVDAALAHVTELRPVDVTIFGGVVDPQKLHFPFNRMPAVDARDWEAIRGWAVRLPALLGMAPARSGG